MGADVSGKLSIEYSRRLGSIPAGIVDSLDIIEEFYLIDRAPDSILRRVRLALKHSPSNMIRCGTRRHSNFTSGGSRSRLDANEE